MSLSYHSLIYFIIMAEIFKLVPHEPTTESKLMLVKQRNDRELISLTILGWYRVLPNKTVIPVVNPQSGMYQCTPLDNHCSIQVALSYKISQKIINKTIKSNIVTLGKQLKERALYVIESLNCRVSIDQFSVYMKVLVDNKKLKFTTEYGKFQIPLGDNTVEIEPFNFIVKVNFSAFSNQFLRFYCDSLKWIPKFRSNYCFCIFNSKMEQDLFLVSVSDAFREPVPSSNQIKIVSHLSTTPRNGPPLGLSEKQLKNDGSASSLASNNKSQQKNRQKVKISERLNLKKSCTKLNSNKISSNKRECLNIFEEDSQSNQNSDVVNKRSQQQSIFKQSDASMDLRGSFQQLQKNMVQVEEDKLSNHSFKQKDTKNKDSVNEQENSKLRSENARLKKQIEAMGQAVKEATALKRKYLNVVQQLNRLESERIAIVKDKMKFQSAYYEEMQEKQKLKKEIEILKGSAPGQRTFKI